MTAGSGGGDPGGSSRASSGRPPTAHSHQMPPSPQAAAPPRAAGEYVFDQSWANFYHQMGLGRYYPKLQCCVPFTPVTGPRLLARPGPLRGPVMRALAQSLVAVAGACCASPFWTPSSPPPPPPLPRLNSAPPHTPLPPPLP